ncbi:MAG: alpha/beta hydrolase, partial [Sphingomonadaceae bacterium]|nr:alpha/beta hydrolase [Sphingomonadaceae bacterium]
RRGLAVWSVEYRSIDQAGGPYPGMFADVAAAGDRLAKDARRYNLALDRLVIAGHSAGGHLALWEAGRHNIAKPSALAPGAKAHGLRPRAVVNLAGPGALGGDAKTRADKTCGAGSFDAIFGTPTASRPDVFADTLPARLLPLGVKTLQFVGAEDRTVPPQLVLAYDKAARAAGEDITTRVIPGADHMAVVDPRTPAFAEVAVALAELTR